jgi:hypothetical protein
MAHQLLTHGHACALSDGISKAGELLVQYWARCSARFFGWRLLHGALRCSATAVLWCKVGTVQAAGCGLRCAAQPRPALGMRRWRGRRWSPCRTSLCIALWCGRLLLGCAACGPCLWLVGYLRWMSGSCSLGTTLCGTPAVARPGLSCGPTCAFCSAVRFGTCAAAGWPMAKCSLLLLWWL